MGLILKAAAGLRKKVESHDDELSSLHLQLFTLPRSSHMIHPCMFSMKITLHRFQPYSNRSKKAAAWWDRSPFVLPEFLLFLSFRLFLDDLAQCGMVERWGRVSKLHNGVPKCRSASHHVYTRSRGFGCRGLASNIESMSHQVKKPLSSVAYVAGWLCRTRVWSKKGQIRWGRWLVPGKKMI